jgi:RNA 3'-terminal phosphate cyclase (ATP)
VVRALGAISDAEVRGDRLDSTELEFSPRTLRGGRLHFDVGAERGSAGAVSLLFQALLLPLAAAPAPSAVTLRGGTHVRWSPPFHFLTGVFLPTLRQVGFEAEAALHRWGWYPRGGGEIEARITPATRPRGLGWIAPPAPERITGLSAVSRLPGAIAERQRRRALERLGTCGLPTEIAVVEDASALGPGTLLFLTVSGARAAAGFSALGRRGLRAESVADDAVDRLLAYLASGAHVDDHLADQLVPFLALAGEPSVFTCPTLSGHLRTVAWVVQQFIDVRIDLEDGAPAQVRITPPGPVVPSSPCPG